MPQWRKQLLKIIPAGNALYDSASMTMAAAALLHEESFDQSAKVILLGCVSFFSWLQSYKLCAQETIEGIEDTCQTVVSRRIPRGWVPLSRRNEIIAVTIASSLSVCAISSDFFGGLYFMGEIPEDYQITDSINTKGWLFLALTTGIISGVTTLFTEGKGLYFHVRRLLAGERNEYKSTLGKYLCYSLGYPIAIIGNLEAICEANSAMTDTLSPQSQLGRYGVLMCSVPKGIGDFFFSGKFAIEAIDNFTARMLAIPDKPISRQEAMAFFLSVTVATIVEFPQPSLTLELLDDSETTLPFPVHPVIQNILGYGVSVRDGLVLMLTLFPLFLAFVNNLEKRIAKTWEKRPCHETIDPELEEEKNYVPLGGQDISFCLPDNQAEVPSTFSFVNGLTNSWSSIWHKSHPRLAESSEAELSRTTDSAASLQDSSSMPASRDSSSVYVERSEALFAPFLR